MKKATRGQMKTAAEFYLLLLRSRGGGEKKHLNSTASLTLIYETSSCENGADLPLWPSLSHIFPAPIIVSPSGHSMLGLSIVREPRRTGLNHPRLSTAFHSPRPKRLKKKQQNLNSWNIHPRHARKMWFNFTVNNLWIGWGEAWAGDGSVFASSACARW